MILKKTKLEGVRLILLEQSKDDRGYFLRTFCKKDYQTQGIDFQIVQINRSFNSQSGTLRGLHFQKRPYAEAKIIQVLQGAILDVIVDLRPKSATYGQWISEVLSNQNRKVLYVPKGFAHGYQTLTDNCEIEYFMDQFYHPESASGIRWNDPHFKITWPLNNPLFSTKDNNLPLFTNV